MKKISIKKFLKYLLTVSSDKISIETIPIENHGPFAAPEWLVPTAIFAYISKPYFDTFLKEMGKDHYNLLKKGFSYLYENVIGSNAPKLTVITDSSSPNKIMKDNPYSLYFSITADSQTKLKFKLLIRKECTFETYQETINTFLDFLENYHNNKLDASFIEELHKNHISKTILVAYDTNTSMLKFLTMKDMING